MNKKSLFIALAIVQNFSLFAQNLESNRGKIEKAQSELMIPFSQYFDNTMTTDLDTLFTILITSKEYNPKDEFHNYLIGQSDFQRNSIPSLGNFEPNIA